MTTRRSHTCNLCHGNVANEAMGVGMLWETGNAIKFTTPGQAETHICQTCIEGLETALYDMREMERKRAEIDATNSQQ